jgi:surfeit locus 1 family protein
VVVAAVCARLGVWQLDRLAERRDFNAQMGAALTSEPTPLETLLTGGEDPTYRRVTASGTWDTTHEVILYGRSLDGRPGNHVLTPLELGDERAVLVDRGWVPTEVTEPPVTGGAAAPGGDVTVEGIVLPSDDAGADARAGAGAGAGSTLPSQVRTVEIGALDAAIPSELVSDAYLLLQNQVPARDRPIPAPPPELTEGPHLSYAIQWFTFAAIALIGYGLLVRRGRRAVAAPQTASDDGRD